MSITFGTDGWRAVISDEFTFANVRHVAQAIAEVLLENASSSAKNESASTPMAVVGFDTRFLSDRYAWAVSESSGRQRIARRAHQGRRAHPGRFLRYPAHERSWRRDDHGQPQSAAL